MATRTRRTQQRALDTPSAHPRSIATIAPEPETGGAPDQPFVEGVRDEIDPDLRHRLISEAAYHLYGQRGFAEGYEVDDWKEAEAEVDHLLIESAVAPTK